MIKAIIIVVVSLCAVAVIDRIRRHQRTIDHLLGPTGVHLNRPTGRVEVQDRLLFAGVADGCGLWEVPVDDEEMHELNTGRATFGCDTLPGKTALRFFHVDERGRD